MSREQDIKRIIRIGLLSFFFLFIILYAFFRSKDLIFGTKLRNVVFESSYTEAGIQESRLQITGNARHATLVTINDREITINQEGDFSETIALLSGYNIVTLYAEDKFGNNDLKDFHLIGGQARLVDGQIH